MITRYDAVARGLGAVLLVCGIFALFGAPPWWWMGLGFIGASFSVIRASGSIDGLWAAYAGALRKRRRLGPVEFRWSRLIAEIACIAVIGVVVVTILGSATLGDRPVNGDHPVHYFKAYNFEHNLLRHGSLRGWTNLWYAGDPINYLYPFGADLFVVLVHALSLGILSLSKAYGLAIFLFWALYGYSVYRLGAVTSGRWVGLAAALLAITDPGGARAGGWHQAVYVGVWPQTLAVAFATFSLCLLPSLIRRQSWRTVAWFALFMGASLVTHPLVLFLYALAPVLALLILCGRLRRPMPSVLLRILTALGVGTLIGAAYWLPFGALKDWSIPTGVAWYSADEVGEKLAGLEGIFGMPRVVVALGLLGTLAALGSRRLMLRLGAVLVIVLLGFAGSTLPNDFHLHALLRALYSVQYERYLILLKPFFFVLAANAVFALFGTLRRAPTAEPKTPRAKLLGAVGLGVLTYIAVTALAPIAVPFGRNVSGGLTHLERASARPVARAQMVSWLNAHLPRDGFYRVAVNMRSHSAIDLGAETDFPLYKFGGGPVALFKYRMLGHDDRLLQALNVRYVVTDHAYGSTNLSLVQSFPPFYIYEFKRYQAEPFTIEGSGNVRVTRFDTNVIELVAAPGSTGRLRLEISYFPRWHATLDGREVPIQAQPFGIEPFTGFMSVALRPGHYRFEFRQNALDHFASALSVIGLILAVGLWLLDLRAERALRIRRALTRALAWVAQKTRPAATIAAGAVLGLLLLTGPALATYSPPLQVGATPLHDESVRYDFGDHLANARVRRGDLPCVWSMDGFRCGDVNDVVSFGLEGVDDYLVRQCVLARPIGRTLSIEYSKLPPGKFLVGYVGVSESSSAASCSFSLEIDDRTVYETETIRRGEVTRFRSALNGPIGSVRFDMRGGENDVVCFQAQVVGR